jgi:hypothetical protein
LVPLVFFVQSFSTPFFQGSSAPISMQSRLPAPLFGVLRVVKELGMETPEKAANGTAVLQRIHVIRLNTRCAYFYWSIDFKNQPLPSPQHPHLDLRRGNHKGGRPFHTTPA